MLTNAHSPAFYDVTLLFLRGLSALFPLAFPGFAIFLLTLHPECLSVKPGLAIYLWSSHFLALKLGELLTLSCLSFPHA